MLEISPDLRLPPEAVTQTIIVYGGKGMGKTNFASVFAEELFKNNLRFSVIDPMGVWYGLQYGRTKRQSGLEVLILGGIHGDLPIEPTAGAIVADLVADEKISVVIDISRHPSGKAWSKGEKVRFVTAYMIRLYERQVERRQPIMQIIDEAARYAPQSFIHGDKDAAHCLGAIQMICEEGRNLGIGLTLITQRSARLNKDVAELADILIAFRVVGPNSVSAILDWFGDHIPRDRHKSLVEQLRRLPIGTALIVSPGWLDIESAAAIRERQTFDSSATPKPGIDSKAPGKAVKPDLDKYRRLMAETIEKATSTDPKALQKEINRLQSELAKAHGKEIEKIIDKEILIPVIDRECLKRLELSLTTYLQKLETGLNNAIKSQFDQITPEEMYQAIKDAESRTPVADTGQMMSSIKPKTKWLPDQTAIQAPRRESPDAAGGSLPSGEKAILTVCAQFVRLNGATRTMIGVLTGYKKSSRNAYISRLQSKGYLQVNSDGRIVATDQGRDALGKDFEPLPTGEKLRQYWIDQLPGGESDIFQILIDNHPISFSRDQIGQMSNYKKSSRNAYISRLAAKELIRIDSNGQIILSEFLFIN